jgi:hypothetical protein
VCFSRSQALSTMPKDEKDKEKKKSSSTAKVKKEVKSRELKREL